MARDDLDPARGVVWAALAGVAFWLIVGAAFLRAAPTADFSNVVGGVVGRDPVYTRLAIAVAPGVRVPAAFARYRRTIETEAVRIMGPTAARPAFNAAQLHQESGFNPLARSYVGATGLGQFMPGTAEDMAARYPECRPADPLSPTWAIRCSIIYDRELYTSPTARVAGGELSACTRWAFALSSYNGGAGWLSRDRTLAAKAGRSPDRWHGNVDAYSARSAAAKRENRDYIERIMVQLAPAYVAAGMIGPLCTEPF